MSSLSSTKNVFSSRSSPHINNISTFADDLFGTPFNSAISRALPIQDNYYSKVCVLGMTWSNDNTGSKQQVDRITTTKGASVTTWNGDGRVDRVLYMYNTCHATDQGAHPTEEAAFYEGGLEVLAATNSTASPSISSTRLPGFRAALTAHLRPLDATPRSVTQVFAALCRDAVSQQAAQLPVRVLAPSTASTVLAPLPDAPHALLPMHQMNSLRAEWMHRQESRPPSERVLVSVAMAEDVHPAHIEAAGKQKLAGTAYAKIEAIIPGVPVVMLVTLPYECSSLTRPCFGIKLEPFRVITQVPDRKLEKAS